MSFIVTVSFQGTARVWRLADGTLVATLEGRHTGEENPACVSPDGVHVVTTSVDRTARVWRLADGTLVRTLEGHTRKVLSVCVSPDGVHVVTTSMDRTARRKLRSECDALLGSTH